MTFFLDNCICPHFAVLLKAFGEDAQHLSERFTPDTSDADWIPKICKERRIIITGDKAQFKGKGKTLVEARLYQKHRGIAYYLASGCTEAPRWRQTALFFRCWEKIIEHAPSAKRGDVFSVSITGHIEKKHLMKVN